MPASLVEADPVTQFAEEVCTGLTKPGQKELPSKYLYDEIGSALFEVISVLPEYGLTRADQRILQQHAESIVARIPSPVIVAELGSGSGKKTRWILEALARRQPTLYHPIEISPSALAMCEHELDRLESVSILGFETEYLDGLRRVAARRESGQRVLVLFLGSSIGNFDRQPGEEFLRRVRQTLIPGDALLLGTDLEKPVSQMICAYDDPIGVTAAFNLNLLARINRELDGNFALSQFRHVARYDTKHRRIEMHLLSTRAQTATIGKAGLAVNLHEGETLWTESSHKYNREEVVQMAERTGFRCDGQWLDPEWPFAQSLLRAVGRTPNPGAIPT
jgi:L-histidine Nalpha-methyltransferase